MNLSDYCEHGRPSFGGCNECQDLVPKLRLIILGYQQAAQRLLDARYADGECDSNALFGYSVRMEELAEKYIKLSSED